MNRRFLIILIVFVIPLTGCPLWPVKEADLDRECVYNKTSDYESDLPFNMPLFYKKLEKYEYNGVDMGGFYFLGETMGDTTIFQTPGNLNNETFLVNDKYNILTYIDINSHLANSVISLDSSEFDYMNKIIEDQIISNLIYEYYEEYFNEIDNFLEESNVKSFWDMDQMLCGRSASLSSISLAHPNINKYISLDFEYVLNKEQKEVISNAIMNNTLSVKVNKELALLIEELLNMRKIRLAKFNVIVAIPGIDDTTSIDYIAEYESNFNSNFQLDLGKIIEEVGLKLEEGGLKKDNGTYEEYVYYLYYTDKIQTGEER